jgi:hypothetical protein
MSNYFNHALLEYLVFDEAHTFTGAAGAETACLIRRLRTFCGKSATETTCIATSATIADAQLGKEAGRDFAARFFGVRKDGVAIVGEEYEPDIWETSRQIPLPLAGNPAVHLKNVLEAVEAGEQAGILVKAVFQGMTGTSLDATNWQESLYHHLASNELVFQLAEALRNPRLLSELIADLERRVRRPVPETEVLAWLALGAASRKNSRPLLRPVHPRLHPGCRRCCRHFSVKFGSRESGARTPAIVVICRRCSRRKRRRLISTSCNHLHHLRTALFHPSGCRLQIL